MLRTIHVGLDGSTVSASAARFAIDLAATHSATLFGHAPVSEPFVTEAEAMPMGGTYFAGHRDEPRLAAAKAKAGDVLANFKTQCGSLACETQLDVGDPATLLHQRAEMADLSVIGAATFFHFENIKEPDAVLDAVLHHPPRPVVVVPIVVPSGDGVVVAYDGSAEAARALFAFVHSGILPSSRVTVVTVADDAATIAARGVSYLQQHGRNAIAKLAETTRPAGEVIRETVASTQAGLLVMGAFRHSSLHQFFFGSTTKRVLDHVAVPVFLFH